MPWWEYEAAKKYPWVPLDRSEGDGPWWGFAFWIVGALAMLASVVGIFVSGWVISGWALAVAAVSFVLSSLLLRNKRPRRS